MRRPAEKEERAAEKIPAGKREGRAAGQSSGEL